MTNKTVLSDARIERLSKQYDCDFMGFKGFALAVIDEVLQSPEIQQDKLDAERYRAWRHAVVNHEDSFLKVALNALPHTETGAPLPVDNDAWDAAIDAAMEVKP